MSSLCDDILLNSKYVVDNATNVKINNNKIPEYTDFILSKYKGRFINELSADIHYISDNKEETLSYILLMDSINFGSGYFEIAKSLGVNFNYISVAESLKKLFEKREFNSAEKWVNVTEKYISKILYLPQGWDSQIDNLISLFVLSIQNVGKNIILDYGGKVENLIKAAEGSAVKLVNIVAGWKSFKDSCLYKGKEVFILKRAQILVADINLVYKCFSDIDKLTIFADNMVPHVLRSDSLITYSKSLSKKIDNGEFILSGSEEEVEIRASAIYAIYLMKEYTNKNIMMIDLDRLLWHRGETDPDFTGGDCLYHRTLTTCY